MIHDDVTETETVFYVGVSRNMYGREIPPGWFKAICTGWIEIDDRRVPVWNERGPFVSEQEARGA